MMKNLLFLWWIIFLMTSLSGCVRKTTTKTYKHLDSLAAKYPDSVLHLLEQMEEQLPNLSPEERMYRAYIQAEAHLRLGSSLAEDTLLPEAVAYYRKRNDKTKMLSGYRLEANYLKWRKNENKALAILNRGLQQAIDDKDSFYIAALLYDKALLYYEHYRDYDKTTTCLKQALHYPPFFSEIPKYDIIYLLAINLGLSADDSCDYYFQQSIKLAEEAGDTTAVHHYLRNYASNLSRRGRTKESTATIHRLWKMSPQYRNYSITHMILAENFFHNHMTDSACYYLDKAYKSNLCEEKQYGVDVSKRNILYVLQNITNYALGKEFSTTPIGRFGDSIMLDYEERQKDMEQKMNSKIQLEHLNSSLVINKQHTQLLLACFIFVSFFSGLLIFIYVRSRRTRLAEAEDRIEVLTRLLNDVGQNEGTNSSTTFFKKVLLQQLGIIRLIATVPTSHNQELLQRIIGITNKKVSVESLLVWDDLYPIIDAAYDGFYSRMKNLCGHLLSDKEKQICCLLRAGFSTKEIAVVTQQTIATVYVRKSSIRKKLRMDEKEDIATYIESIKSPI